jgi:hypothetical protein
MPARGRAASTDELKNESLKRKWRFMAKKLIFQLTIRTELDI